MSAYTTRYTEYARVHGRTPDEMARAEAHNAGYIIWICARLDEWRAETGYQGSLGGEPAREFDEWLARVPAIERRDA